MANTFIDFIGSQSFGSTNDYFASAAIGDQMYITFSQYFTVSTNAAQKGGPQTHDTGLRNVALGCCKST